MLGDCHLHHNSIVKPVTAGECCGHITQAAGTCLPFSTQKDFVDFYWKETLAVTQAWGVQ